MSAPCAVDHDPLMICARPGSPEGELHRPREGPRVPSNGMESDKNGSQALVIGDRRPDGRFAPGCRPGPGRRAGDSRQYSEAFRRAVSAEDLEEVVERALKDAKGGNLAAARLILERCLPAVVPPAPEAPAGLSIQAQVLQRLSPGARLELIRAVQEQRRLGYSLDEPLSPEVG